MVTKENIAKYFTVAESGCWLWKKSVSPFGYVQIKGGKRENGRWFYVMAHRRSWEIFSGEIPKGMMVCHKCDVRHCVNPDHLFLGTHADNMHDRNAKGRQATGWAIGKGGAKRRGENNGRAKLSREDVVRIKELYAGGRSQDSIAKEYGVVQPHISRIIRNVAWE